MKKKIITFQFHKQQFDTLAHGKQTHKHRSY